MKQLRRTALKFSLLFVAIAFLLPASICAKKQAGLLPQRYAKLQKGDVSSIRRMLEEGISVNAVDEKGNSLLMLASYEGDMKKVKFLIENGADIHQRNEKEFLHLGDTPLDYAIRGKHKKLVDLYLSLNVDVNAKFRRAMSTIYKCGMRRNYPMLRYLLEEKGVIVSDEDKINTMLMTLPYYNAPVTPDERQIIGLLLQDLEVEADDLWKSSLVDRDNPRDVKKVETILRIQDSEKDTKKKRMAEQRVQDSLQMLLDSGKADTLRFTYTKVDVRVGKEEKSKIVVNPRVDAVVNEQGEKSSAISWILWGFTILTVYYCCGQIVTHVYKERPTYLFPYIAIYLLGGWALYSIFSCMYRNLDDIMVRKQGEEKIAVLDIETSYRQYKSRGQYHSYTLTDYHFVFTGNDSIRIAVNQGRTCFDANDYPEEERSRIKVRYDSASHKLSVDNDKYFMQNLVWIAFMVLLLLLILMFSWGQFNGVLNAIQRKLHKRADTKYKPLEVEPRVQVEDIQMEDLEYFGDEVCVDTYWELSDKEYLSMEDFIRDVQRSEQMHGSEPDERIHPDRILFRHPNALITLYPFAWSPLEGATSSETIKISLTSDNGAYFTEGELLFKVHHAMIPYLDRLKSHTLAVIFGIAYRKSTDTAECAIMFQPEVE